MEDAGGELFSLGGGRKEGILGTELMEWFADLYNRCDGDCRGLYIVYLDERKYEEQMREKPSWRC